MAEFNWTVDDIERAQRDFSYNFMRLDCIRTESYNVAIDCMTECIEKKSTNVQLVDRWINAQKNPPPIVDRRSMTSESVLILRDNGRCAVAYYCYDAEDGNYWTTDDDKTMYEWGEVTHWQPLPEPPKYEGAEFKPMENPNGGLK